MRLRMRWLLTITTLLACSTADAQVLRKVGTGTLTNAAATADNTALATGMYVNSMCMYYDGATLDMCRGTAANGMLTYTGIEDAAEASGMSLAMAGGVVRATQAGSTATDADNGTLNLTTWGALFTTSMPSPGTITVAQVDVAASGTSVQGASAAAKACWISCPTLNTSGCYVRMSTGNGVTGGFSVPKAAIVGPLPCTNTNIFWFDAGTSGDDVTILSVN